MNKSIINKCSTCIFKYTEFGKDYDPLSSDAVLSEVIDDWISDLETEDIYILPKLLEKMKDFRVKHFS